MDDETFGETLRRAAGDASRLEALGRAEARAGRIDRAADAFRMAVAAAPDEPLLHHALGALCLRLQRTEEAGEALRRCVALAPDFAAARADLAALALGAGRLADAASHAAAAVELNPGNAGALVNLGKVASERGRQDEAIARFRRALEIDPACAPARSNLLLSLCYAEVEPDALLAEHRRLARDLEPPGGSPPPPAPVDPDPDRTLRVGLVSRDLKSHSVAYFLTPLLRGHDPEAMELVAYSDVPEAHEDPVSAAIHEAVDGLVRCASLSDDALAARVRADRIDVLVDLGGHTAGNRLTLFARRVAPLQATWLGYPCTTGLAAMDVRLVDAVTDPPGNEAWVSERLVRIEGCAYAYDPPPDLPPVAPAPCLRGRGVTFGSFNNLAKVGPAVLDLWARVLAATPGSRLVIKAKQLNDPETGRLLADGLAARGVARERVVLLRPPARRDDHLATYGEVDVALDPFPFGGVTTTCEAAVMGVPVVSLLGRLHAGRVGATLLRALGLGSLVAATPDRYVETAAFLASDVERLARLRAGLREAYRQSPLADATGYARRFEAAIRSAWRDLVAPGREG
jgi:predicted O-linked N-acetylglucosamine transferase (SPINDLY family)